MKKQENGITLIKLLIIIFLILILSGLIIYFSKSISPMMTIAYQSITKQIDIKDEIENNEILLGITNVTGEGVILNILDGNDLIHQEDLIILLDELKNAGSQAICVNDIRITNSTYLYCDGSVILIDGEKIGNPFTIKAIGDGETIYGALTRNKGYVSTLQNDGLKIDIEKSNDVKIPKTNNKTLLNYAEDKTEIGSLHYSNQLIGKSAVKGKGIQIVIREKKAKLTALSFLQIVNDLNSADAKAISINGQRVTNMTDIMDISNEYVLINSIPISSPFIINAVGNQDKIEEVLNYNNSYITKIKEKENPVEIYRFNSLKVEPYTQKKDKDKMSIDYLK